MPKQYLTLFSKIRFKSINHLALPSTQTLWKPVITKSRQRIFKNKCIKPSLSKKRNHSPQFFFWLCVKLMQPSYFNDDYNCIHSTTLAKCFLKFCSSKVIILLLSVFVRIGTNRKKTLRTTNTCVLVVSRQRRPKSKLYIHFCLKPGAMGFSFLN